MNLSTKTTTLEAEFASLKVITDTASKDIVSLYDVDNRWFLDTTHPHEAIKAWATVHGFTDVPKEVQDAKVVPYESLIQPEFYAQHRAAEDNALFFDLAQDGTIRSIYEHESEDFVNTDNLFAWMRQWAQNAGSWDLTHWDKRKIRDLDTNLPLPVRKLIANGISTLPPEVDL